MPRILGVFLIALLVAGCGGAAATQAPAVPSAAPPQASASQSGAFGGKVQFKSDGSPATTTLDVVADGGTVSGTAVTEFANGTHTVKLSCASQNGDWWAVGGKTEQTTVHGEKAGDWSAVIVRNGSPQLIGIWLSDDPSSASDCNAWLGKTDFSNIGVENFDAVDSGTLLAPPGLAP